MLPGVLSPSKGLAVEDILNGLGALSRIPATGCGQIVAFCAFRELFQDQSAGADATAGDFGWKVLTSSAAAAERSELAAEIAIVPSAIIAIIGMFVDMFSIPSQRFWSTWLWVLGACARRWKLGYSIVAVSQQCV
ncbi:unnamed protein product, partial [Prorocentrum cordatum]